MLLIADSGSTKTCWVLLKGKEIIKRFYTKGFNPYLQTEIEISNALNTEVKEVLKSFLTQIQNVYFYGAGCSADDKNKLITNGIRSFLPQANVVVQHDLLGAALALLGYESGIAAILGTGSNSCLVINGIIKQNIPSLGLYLGDEGSGGYMGKLFVRNYFYGKFSESTQQLINQELTLNKEDVLENVYKRPFPNRYLASFTYFIAKHISIPEIKNIVTQGFNDFINTTICRYPNYKSYPLSVVGSVGFIFKDILNEVCLEHHIQLKKVLKEPIDGLIEYHALGN